LQDEGQREKEGGPEGSGHFGEEGDRSRSYGRSLNNRNRIVEERNRYSSALRQLQIVLGILKWLGLKFEQIIRPL